MLKNNYMYAIVMNSYRMGRLISCGKFKGNFLTREIFALGFESYDNVDKEKNDMK